MSWSCCDEMFNDGRNEAEAEAAATISQLQAEIARLREALTPFAAAAEHVDLDDVRHDPDTTLFSSSARYEVKCRHLLDARSALGGSNDKG